MKKKKWLPMLAGLLIFPLFLSGCGADRESATKTTEKEPLKIVTSFYPMYIATINITKDVEGVTVKNMTKPQTGCLHDYQMTPEDMKTLEKADIFIVNGAGMESFLEKAIKQQKQLKIVEASKDITLLKENGTENPHVWVSVSGAVAQVKNIAAQLAAIDEKNAARYQENAATYIAKLETLKQTMHQQLDGLQNKNIVTFHEAFPYFAQEFDLEIVAVIEREPGSDPSPKELEKTIAIIKTLQMKALFAEPQYSAGAADTIAQESGAKVYTLDPVVTGDAVEDADDAYIDAMKKNASVLEEALR